jgi:hypothetical protein
LHQFEDNKIDVVLDSSEKLFPKDDEHPDGYDIRWY